MARKDPVKAAELMEAFVALVRAFGLHRPDQTPCGEPVAVAEAHALMDLAEGGTLNQGELAARLHLEKSTVSRLVRQMEAHGWIERTGAAHDGRIVSLRLTKKGRATAARLAQARQAKFARLLTALPEEKRVMVAEAITVLAEAAQSAG